MPQPFRLTPLVRSESSEAKAFMRWRRSAEKKHPELEMLYHIPNGGLRDIQTAVRLKQEGVKPGIPDYCLPIARGGYNALYIELKRTDGSGLSDEQQKVMTQLAKYGNFATVCPGWKNARDAVLLYLGMAHEACEG